MLAKIIVLFCSVYACTAHLCMLSPPQRTPLKNINKPGSDSCILLKGPCGGTTPSTSRLSLVAGSNFTVVFQKNLNHFDAANPGYWTVAMAKSEKSSFTELYRIADSDVPSLTLYTATITLPDVALGDKSLPLVIQTRYVTNNPGAPAMFYQCSDILLRKAD